LVKTAEAFDAGVDVAQVVVCTGQYSTAVTFDRLIGQALRRMFVELVISVMFMAATGVAATCASLLLSAVSL
jgi:hypothetical protein